MDKFYAALVSGEGLPDISMLVKRVSSKYLISELLYDFTDFVNENRDYYNEGQIAQCTSVDGKVLGVDIEYLPAVVFYLEEVINELGIDVNGIKTWDDYYNVVTEVCESNPEYFSQPLHYPGGTWGTSYWKLWVQGAGKNIFDDEGNLIKDNKEVKEITNFYYKLMTESNSLKAPINDPSIFDAIREGKLLFYPYNSCMGNVVRDIIPDFEYTMAAFPWPLYEEDGELLTGDWGSTTLFVPMAGKNPEMAAEFVKFFALNEEILTEVWFSDMTTGGIPAHSLIQENLLEQADRDLYVKNLTKSIAAREVSTWNYITDWPVVEKFLADSLDSMIAGQIGSNEAWDLLETQLGKALGQ